MATIVVKQIGSPIRRPAKQRATLVGLGLNKRHGEFDPAPGRDHRRKEVTQRGPVPPVRLQGAPVHRTGASLCICYGWVSYFRHCGNRTP